MSVCFEARGATSEEQWMDYHFWQLTVLYKKACCLWKKDARHYLNSERRYRAYQKIQEAMGMPGLTVVGVVLKIREMRRLYVKELKKLLDKELCCNCHEPSISWFYDLHRFLYPYLDYDEAVELRVSIDFTRVHFLRSSRIECFGQSGSTQLSLAGSEDAGRAGADPRETDDRDPSRDSADGYHSDCPLRRRDRVCEGCFPAPGTMYSISSPAVSLPEVKAQPGTCPPSCVDSTSASRTVRLDVTASSSCFERPRQRILSTSDVSTGPRQVDRSRLNSEQAAGRDKNCASIKSERVVSQPVITIFEPCRQVRRESAPLGVSSETKGLIAPVLHAWEAREAPCCSRQERCHEFRIRGVSGTSTYTCETDSSDESFSSIVSRCLRKLETPLAVKAKMEILRLLRNFMEESKRTVKCRRARG
ncbi:uncharacterized protein LOC143211145 [Lasioglossum baleicum]|uniref:uncharacterized protein LOC143211145 n=1 Tax=Lasioglossum baleicum TaxID=434251 RepID=UPI003FCE893F